MPPVQPSGLLQAICRLRSAQFHGVWERADPSSHTKLSVLTVGSTWRSGHGVPFRDLQDPPGTQPNRWAILHISSAFCRGTVHLARQAHSISRHQRDDGKASERRAAEAVFRRRCSSMYKSEMQALETRLGCCGRGLRSPVGHTAQGVKVLCEVRDHLGPGQPATSRIWQASSQICA